MEKFNNYSTWDIANIYQESELTEWATPDFIGGAKLCTTDVLYPNQWHMHRIDIEDAWDITKGSNNLIIAVIDEGVDLNHNEFYSGQFISGYDFSTEYYGSNGNYKYPGHAHGSCCAGILAAGHNNGGIRGIAPNCKIMPLRIDFNETPLKPGYLIMPLLSVMLGPMGQM